MGLDKHAPAPVPAPVPAQAQAFQGAHRLRRCMGIDTGKPAKEVLLQLRAFNDGYNQSFANEGLPSVEEIEQIPDNVILADYLKENMHVFNYL